MSGEVEERIIVAAITLLEREGVDRVGIREIAAEAGVNSAAISYYFRSKDNLLRMALERTLDQAFGQLPVELDQLLAGGMAPKAAFEALLSEYLFRAVGFPRITFAHLRDALVDQKYDGPGVVMVNRMLVELADRLAPAFPHRTAAQLRLALAQIWSGIFLWAMAPGLFSGLAELDFKAREGCHAWAAQMVSLLDGPPEWSRSLTWTWTWTLRLRAGCGIRVDRRCSRGRAGVWRNW